MMGHTLMETHMHTAIAHSRSLVADALSRVERDILTLRAYHAADRRANLSIGDLMLDMVDRNSNAVYDIAPRGDTSAAWRSSDALAERSQNLSVGTHLFYARPGRRDCAIVGWDLLGAQTRAMATSPGGKGGYAVGVDTLPVQGPLWQDSVIGVAGVQTISGLTDNAVIPRVITTPTVTIQTGDGVAPAASDPALGAVSIVPRTGLCRVQCSIQQARQAPDIQAFLARLLFRALRAKFDYLLMQGSGASGEPQGLLNIPTGAGIQQVSGTTLALAGLLDAQEKCSTSGAPDSRMVWVGHGSVRKLIGSRERTTGSGRMLWDDGLILGGPAIATPDAPASTLFVGDFSNAVLALFGDGIELRFDPANDWDKGLIAWQVFAMFDLVVTQPSAFVRVASIT